jgi:predicted RNase H-like nuclease (RuvC/YqgF family)
MISYNDLLTACEQQEKEIENLKKELQIKNEEEETEDLRGRIFRVKSRLIGIIIKQKKELKNKDNEIAATKKLLEKATEKISTLGIQITQQAGIIARLEKINEQDR